MKHACAFIVNFINYEDCTFYLPYLQSTGPISYSDTSETDNPVKGYADLAAAWEYMQFFFKKV